jgi:hypothetical protein
VSADQCKTGLFEMIERGPAPFGRVVARSAVRATAAPVNIVGAVAGHTRFRQSLPDFVDVTPLADHIDVRPAQIERSLRMIETNVGPGTVFAMATGAFFAESFHVGLCLTMTCNALDRGFSERLALHVTGTAVPTDVAAPERKIRSIVIERRTIQTHDVGVAALMLGVTVLAQQLRLVLRDAAMEARQRCHVGTNFLVTVHTQRRLLGRDERPVTVRAIVFQIGVTFDHRTGHDQSFEARCKRHARHEQRQNQHDACPTVQSHD